MCKHNNIGKAFASTYNDNGKFYLAHVCTDCGKVVYRRFGDSKKVTVKIPNKKNQPSEREIQMAMG